MWVVADVMAVPLALFTSSKPSSDTSSMLRFTVSELLLHQKLQIRTHKPM